MYLLVGIVGLIPSARAQDGFEIHVLEYEPLKLGEYTLEAHLNWLAQGNRSADDTLLQTHYQTHLTLEPTIGLSSNAAVGFMLLNAYEPGFSPQFAGWRVLPHSYAPESWPLPFHAGFIAEFSFTKTRYEENSRQVELRLILDRQFAKWQVVFNPVFERPLHGPGTERGWNFEPELLIRYNRRVFSPSIEYSGESTASTCAAMPNPNTTAFTPASISR